MKVYTQSGNGKDRTLSLAQQDRWWTKDAAATEEGRSTSQTTTELWTDRWLFRLFYFLVTIPIPDFESWGGSERDMTEASVSSSTHAFRERCALISNHMVRDEKIIAQDIPGYTMLISLTCRAMRL